MTRNLNVFRLSLLAAVALIAVVASLAGADGGKEDFFYFSQESAVVTGSSANEGPLIFGINGGKNKIECASGTLAGTALGKKRMEVTLHPTFMECQMAGFGVMTADTQKCNFNFSGRTDAAGDAAVEIECVEAIKFTNASCHITFGPQTSNGASYTNGIEPVIGRKDVTIKMTLVKLEYQLENAKPLGCVGLGGAGMDFDGTFNGAYTATAYEDFGGPTEEDKFMEGAVIDWWVE